MGRKKKGAAAPVWSPTQFSEDGTIFRSSFSSRRWQDGFMQRRVASHGAAFPNHEQLISITDSYCAGQGAEREGQYTGIDRTNPVMSPRSSQAGSVMFSRICQFASLCASSGQEGKPAVMRTILTS
jgi:hypothetical protein